MLCIILLQGSRIGRRNDLRLSRGEVEIHNGPANLVGVELKALPRPCEVFGFDLLAVSLAGNIGLPLYPQALRGESCGCRVAVLECVVKGHFERDVQGLGLCRNHVPPRPAHIYRAGTLGRCRFQSVLGTLKGRKKDVRTFKAHRV
jgi:hypothetical protein